MADLVTSVASRTVTVDAVTLSEDKPLRGPAWVDFTLPCDLHVIRDDKIIAAGTTRLNLTDGKGQIQLPTYDPDAISQDGSTDWWIEVRKSWHPNHPYAIRVPAGIDAISLADIVAVQQLSGRDAKYAISNVAISVQGGAGYGGTATYNNGLLALNLTMPPGPKGDKGDPGPASTIPGPPGPAGAVAWSGIVDLSGNAVNGISAKATVARTGGSVTLAVDTMATSGTPADWSSGATALLLPPGFRPAAQTYVDQGYGTSPGMVVNSTGGVVINSSSPQGRWIVTYPTSEPWPDAIAGIDTSAYLRGPAGDASTPGGIGSTQLAAGSVTSPKIADGAVTADKLAPGVLTLAKPSAGSISSNELAAGAVTAAKLAPFTTYHTHNVRAFGAIGDGIADDAPAINAASVAAGMGGHVYFPPGRYRVNSTVTVQQNQRWSGPAMNADGANITGALIQGTFAGTIVQCSPASTIETIRIDGPGANVAGSVGIDITSKSSCTIRDVSVWRCELGIRASSLWYGLFERIFLWKNRTAARFTYCYNVNLVVPRIQCTMDDGTNGTGLQLLDRSYVTIHGGSIEQYGVGIDVGSGSSVTSTGLYQETATSGASGIKLTGAGTIVDIRGSQVYVTNHRAWIDMTSFRPGQLNASGNHFKGGTKGAAYEFAYDWTGSTGGGRINAWGDFWDVVAGGPKYMPDAAFTGGSGIIMPPYGSPPFGALSTTDGRMVFGAHATATLTIGSGAGPTTSRPAMLPQQAGARWFDTTKGKPIWWSGSKWVDATGAAA